MCRINMELYKLLRLLNHTLIKLIFDIIPFRPRAMFTLLLAALINLYFELFEQGKFAFMMLVAGW